MSNYSKRGEDCQHTMDCIWGVDGWCDRPHDRRCVLADVDDRAKEEEKRNALNRLVKLGDMMGDGEHLEPGGAWINKEYKKAMRESGLLKPAKKDTAGIDDFMTKRTKKARCVCGGNLKQTRKGSFRAKCDKCEKVYQLGERRRKNAK